MAEQTYSLWLIPGGVTFVRFDTLIARLAARYGSPRFAPHVTLLGGIELPEAEALDRARALAARLAPYTITLGLVGGEDTFFKALFVRAAPESPTLAANALARQVFGIGSDAEYAPHLSLAYGDFPAATRRRMIDKLGPTLDDAFVVDTLHLYQTAGEVATWREVGAFPLAHAGGMP